MKSMTLGIVLLGVACATPALFGGEAPRGVAGVDVFVKQNPSNCLVTDARGNFVFDGLAPGSHTLTFRSRKAQDTKTTTPNKVTIGTSYTIKIEGTKRVVNQSGLTSDKLLAGVNVNIDVATGGQVRGQVAASGLKRMVWIPKEPGSQIPGHWADASSAEAKARRSDTQTLSREDLQNVMNRGNPNMSDPRPEDGRVQISGR